MKSVRTTTLLFTAAFLVAPIASRATGFDQFVGFGDSTLDTGYFRYNSTGVAAADQMVAAAVAAGARGGYAGPGTMDSTMLAAHFGLSAEPVGHGGTNYANGGAHTVVDAPGHVSAVQQIDTYLSAVRGAANPRGLYIVSTGNNDWIYTLQQGPAWVAANPGYLTGLVDPLTQKVAALQAAGARTIIVPNSFTYAFVLAPPASSPPVTMNDYTRLMAFNAAMWSGLTKAGVNFIPADMDSVFRYVIQHPVQFGFTAESVLPKNAPSKTSALLTTSAMLSPEQDRTFLFIDGAHLTTAGQTIEADYMYSLLAAPSIVALVAEAAVQNGLSRIGSLQLQMEESLRSPADGRLHLWGGVDGNYLRLKNESGLPDLSGNGFDGMAGADLLLPRGMLVGAAVALGEGYQRLPSGGHVDTVDGSLGLYLAQHVGPWWGDAVGILGLQRDRITRVVPLGTFVDHNRAHANGRTLGVALSGGRDFRIGLLSTGPIAGVTLQQVHLGGFTETGTAGISALSFGEQTRRASIGQLGWRGKVERGALRLSGRALWNHDWSGRNREVATSLTSVAAAPYRTDAPAVADDWATVALDAAYQVSHRAVLQVDAAAVVGNPRVSSCRGTVSLVIGY